MWALLAIAAGAVELGAETFVGHDTLVSAPDRSGLGYGVRLRVRPTDRWAGEIVVRRVPGGVEPGVEAVRFLTDANPFVRAFLAAGPELVLTPTPTWGASAGVGLDMELLPWLDARGDARFRLLGPDARGAIFLGFGLMARTPRDHDLDDDGIYNQQDACSTAEDRDEHEDTDGCPDVDNDGDGVLDAADRCPDVAEDDDGFQDADGCLDPDDDGDGFVDDEDHCPRRAEDADGYQDGDGCPEPDNDFDGIADADDVCPGERELENGFEDHDGCPDVYPPEVLTAIGRLQAVQFEGDTAKIARTSRRVLEGIATVLRMYPEVRVDVVATAEAPDDPVARQALADARAAAIVDWLDARGVGRFRLRAVGLAVEPMPDEEEAAPEAAPAEPAAPPASALPPPAGDPPP